MSRTTEDDLLWARSGSKPIIAVRWTDSQARIVRTKKRGHELLMVWKKWYQRKGWDVRGTTQGGYIAYSPDGNVRHAATLCTYDPASLTRLS